MNSLSYSEEIARTSRSNFYPAFLFLPEEKRRALSAVYAFSRLVDDAVDRVEGVEEARRKVDLWKEWLGLCYETASPEGHPLLPDLAQTIRRHEIPRKLFLDLIRGVEMDLSNRSYKTFADLEVYCYHVAGSVGLICNCIFGGNSEAYSRYAVLLGTAFQLTNILRDIGNDLKRDRIYLPLEDLERFSYTTAELRNGIQDERFLRLMQFEVSRVARYFEEARSSLPDRERGHLVPAEVMTRFYEGLLRKIEQRGFPSLHETVSLSAWSKGWILCSSWVRWKLLS